MRLGDADARTVRRLPVLRITVLSLASFWIACAPLSKPTSAQTSGTGALAGNVTDPSGAAIADVLVTATNEATGESRAAQSAANGRYFLALLLPGFYDVEMAKAGFKVAHLAHVRVFVAERTTQDVRLEIGMVSARIIVEASTENLQTQSSALGRVTDGEQIRTLPLVTRNYSQIIALNPGVAAEVTDAGALGPGFSGPAGPGLVSNGATILDNNFQMNGVASMICRAARNSPAASRFPVPTPSRNSRCRRASMTPRSAATLVPTWT